MKDVQPLQARTVSGSGDTKTIEGGEECAEALSFRHGTAVHSCTLAVVPAADLY